MTAQEFIVLAQALREDHIVMMTLACVLASIPAALLVFRGRSPASAAPPALQPVIPPEDDQPAGTFPDVPLPPPLPVVEESGVPVRHWRPVDGWAALGLALLMCLTMGVMSSGPEADLSAVPEAPVPAVPAISAEALAYNFAFQIAVSGLVLFYLTKTRGFSLSRIFGTRRLSVPAILRTGLQWGAAGGLAVWIVSLLLLALVLRLMGMGMEDLTAQPLVQSLTENPLNLQTQIMVFLTAVIGAPLMEELIFRGFLYSTAKRFTHISYAAVASSVLFAVIHANFMSLLPLTLLGLLFTYVYERTRCLPVTMVMHGLFNFVQISFLFYGPKLPPASLKRGVTRCPERMN